MFLSWIFGIFFIFFIALTAITSSVITRIKKERYRNLWEKDKKKETLWSSRQRQILDEITWKTPYWVRQETDARILLWIFRASIILAWASWFLILLANFKIIG